MAYDLFHLPETPNTQIYSSRGTYVWSKPQNITMINFLVIGGGGGGGAGSNQGVTTGGGGGGGAGGGAVTKLLIPAIFIPESLIITVGAGGGSATAGGASVIDIPNGSNVVSTRLIISNGGALGSNGGTSGGAAGAGGTASLATSAIYHNLGIFTSIAGGAGTAGIITGTGTGPTTTTNLTSGGGGGTGRNTAGSRGTPGTITGNGTILPNVPPSDGTIILDGVGGIYSLAPFQSYGGVGAWSSGITAGRCGGLGGNGVYGSGGSGGGASTTCPGGAVPGGKGGDGLVIITCF